MKFWPTYRDGAAHPLMVASKVHYDAGVLGPLGAWQLLEALAETATTLERMTDTNVQAGYPLSAGLYKATFSDGGTGFYVTWESAAYAC